MSKPYSIPTCLGTSLAKNGPAKNGPVFPLLAGNLSPRDTVRLSRPSWPPPDPVKAPHYLAYCGATTVKSLLCFPSRQNKVKSVEVKSFKIQRFPSRKICRGAIVLLNHRRHRLPCVENWRGGPASRIEGRVFCLTENYQFYLCGIPIHQIFAHVVAMRSILSSRCGWWDGRNTATASEGVWILRQHLGRAKIWCEGPVGMLLEMH